MTDPAEADQARPPKAPRVPPHPLYDPVEDAVVWDGRYPMQRVRFRYRRRDGSPSGVLTWEMWRRGRAVIMLPWDPDTDRVAFVEQFRLPVLAAGHEPMQLECPAGLVDAGEDTLACARRELGEETGLDCDRLERFGRFMIAPGGCDEDMDFHLARVRLPETGQVGVQGLGSEHEETGVVVVPVADAFAMVGDGRLLNGPSALCLLYLQANHARLRASWRREDGR